MTHNPHPHRPARAAIAAVLALSTTALTPAIAFAQAIEPAAPAQTQMNVPSAQPAPQSTVQPGPATVNPPVTSTPTQTALPTPSAPQLSTPTLALPTRTATIAAPTNTVERAAKAVRAAPAKAPSPSTVRTAPKPAASATPTSDAATVAVDDTQANGAADGATSLALTLPAPNAATPPAQVGESSASSADPTIAPAPNDRNDWAWIAGLAALFGLGGALVIGRAARKKKPERRYKATGEERIVTTAPPPAGGPEPVFATAMATDSVEAPIVTVRPAPPPAPERVAYMPRTNGSAIGEPVDRPLLEAMIAQPPSDTNPFLTRANRKRRALFLMRNGLETGTRPAKVDARGIDRPRTTAPTMHERTDRDPYRLDEHETV